MKKGQTWVARQVRKLPKGGLQPPQPSPWIRLCNPYFTLINFVRDDKYLHNNFVLSAFQQVAC